MDNSRNRHRLNHAERLKEANTEKKEEKKSGLWDAGFSEDNWTFGNPKSIPDFGIIARKFGKKNE